MKNEDSAPIGEVIYLVPEKLNTIIIIIIFVK
jgi:hypothetical protein